MNNEEKQYLDIVKNIIENGIENDDRTWVWTLSTFWERMIFDLSNWNYPLLTTKKTFFKGVVVELLWLIRWDTNIRYLLQRWIHIWTEWAFQNYLKIQKLEDEYPKYSEKWKAKMKQFEEQIVNDELFSELFWSLGPVYWSQWRNFNNDWIDQLKIVVDSIINNPTSRRHIVTAWNPSKLTEMLLPPCHMTFQFHVDTKNKKLDLQLYQRSADYPLWVPFNIASYSLLVILIAKITWLNPWKLIHITWDSHVYKNQVDWMKIQLERIPFEFPQLVIKKEIKTLEDICELEFEDFELVNYQSHPWIKLPIAV